MEFMSYLTTLAAQATTNFKHPIFLWGIPILFVVIAVLVTRNFVRYGLDDVGRKKLGRMRLIVFILRFLAMAALCIALATPFTELEHESDGNPHAVMLVDRSGSMESYDTSFVPQLQRALSAQLPTTMKEFGSPVESPIGDVLLGQQDHVLLISDGNPTVGVDIMDVAQVYKENNRSISMITLMPVKEDNAVYIDAPASAPLGYPIDINVDVTSSGKREVPLTVLVDGKQIYAGQALGRVTFKPPLGAGFHKIEAHITGDAGNDANAQNNAFYRVVQILERPKVLVLTKERGQLETAMSGLFDVTTVTAMPPADQLGQYSAIVINDRAASAVGDIAGLSDFLRDEAGGKQGGGLVVIGGFNSFDRGSYQNSKLETLLPTKVGKAKKQLGDNSIVFVIQVSGSTTGTKSRLENGRLVEYTEDAPTIDTIKAQAVSAVNSLNLKNNVGVIAFGVSNDGKSYDSVDEALSASVVVISDVKPLYTNKQDIVDKIPRLKGGGTTAPDVALRKAVELLKDKSGDKTIILLTNGRFSAGIGAGDNVPAKANTVSVVENARKRYNIKTQTIGVGSTNEATFAQKVDEAFLKSVAVSGDSTYDRATNFASLIVKYGDPKEKGFGEAFSLVPLSLTHFITRDVDLTATLNGFNEVVPKEGARLLVTTDAGDPAVTTWNYFNGRVAAITVFTGSGLGQLLEGNNSDLVRNTILWAVGDPSRKLDVQTSVPPTVIGKRAEITFVSKQPLTGNCPDTALTFDRSSGDTYIFTFTPTAAGFGSACSAPYAVNGEPETWRAGVNEDLATAVGVSRGGEFTFDQVEAIVEQIKTVSTRITTEKTELRNPFIMLALVLFLVEIFIRRLTQYRKS